MTPGAGDFYLMDWWSSELSENYSDRKHAVELDRKRDGDRVAPSLLEVAAPHGRDSKCRPMESSGSLS